jgi:hypothetical protein
MTANHKRKAGSPVKLLIEDAFHRRQRGKQHAQCQRLRRNRDQHHPVGQHFGTGAHQGAKRQRAAVADRQGFGLTPGEPAHDQERKDDIGHKDRLPAGQRNHPLSHQRRDGRDKGKDHHGKGHDLCHLAALEHVTHHGDGHRARRGCADALNDTGDQQGVQAWRRPAGQGRQNIQRKAGQNGGLAAKGIGQRPGEQGSHPHAQHEGGDDQLRLVRIVGRQGQRDLRQGRQHRVNRQRDGGKQQRQQGDEFGAGRRGRHAKHLWPPNGGSGSRLMRGSTGKVQSKRLGK